MERRAEVLMATGPTSGLYIRVKIGAKKDGTITAAEAELAYEAGAYPGLPVGAGAGVILGPVQARQCADRRLRRGGQPPGRPARIASGGTNAAFWCPNRSSTKWPQKIGTDPLEFRLKNAAKEGDRRPDGPTYGKIVGYAETLKLPSITPALRNPGGRQILRRSVAFGFSGSTAAPVQRHRRGQRRRHR
ncbi:MAG: molybdopterin cofactor-binding domain-containing protein [Caldilineaceae bacterium]